MPYRITESCNQCERCAEQCPMDAIERDENDNFVILNDCDECGECIKVCPVSAIVKEEKERFKDRDINCNSFKETQAIIKKTEEKISQARSSKERKYYAQDILLEAKSLLSCPNYIDKNPNCLDCHSILLRYVQEHRYLANNVIKNSLVRRKYV